MAVCWIFKEKHIEYYPDANCSDPLAVDLICLLR